jgi:hypothetical protein
MDFILENKTEVIKDILAIKRIINKEFPELSKYMGEMHINISYKDGYEISTKNLRDYFNSLNELMEHYALSH